MDRSLYEQHAALETDHWWFVGRRTILEHTIDRWCPASNHRILDVGCGTGGMLPMLSQFGVVEGIEADALAVDHCRNAHPQFDVRRGVVPDDVPGDGSYDLVTAFDVIEHIDDDVSAVAALRNASRPDGGTVIVTVPAMASLWSDHDVVNGHRRRYSRRMLADVLQATGLEICHLSYFNTALLPVVAGVRLAQRRRPPPEAPESDFSMPSPMVNRILTGVFGAERRPVARIGLPLGVSLLAVSRRSGSTSPSSPTTS